jgi:hypothetical protein
MLDRLLISMTPRQAATVAFVSVFVTVIGGILLAFFFRWRNSWKNKLTHRKNCPTRFA